MELRTYQKNIFDTIVKDMDKEHRILVQAATGAGKTIVFSAIARHCVEKYNMRVAILAHRAILVQQAYNKLLSVWPQAKGKIGLACMSVDGYTNMDKPITIGSPVTVANRMYKMSETQLLIIDECHHVPPPNTYSTYRSIINNLEQRYPKMCILGVTATPARMAQGYIFGDDPKLYWWQKLNATVRTSDLQELGYLVPLKVKQAEDITEELKTIRKTARDYDKKDLSAVMEREVHLTSAVHAYQQYGEDRMHVIAFCVTIQHAEKMKELFNSNGISSVVVHSKMSKEDRSSALNDFENGRCRVICNVGVLTEGYDCTSIDCILMCRPTLSPALYQQMVGRGLRIHPNKRNCLLLDLSSNSQKYGDFEDPLIIKSDVGNAGNRKKKNCPAPQEVLIEKPDVSMVDASWSVRRAKVIKWTSQVIGRGKVKVLQLVMTCELECGHAQQTIKHFFDFDGVGLRLQNQDRIIWKTMARSEPPKSTQEAADRIKEFVPDFIQVKNMGGYYRVASWVA